MKKSIASILILVLLLGCWPLGAPAYAEVLNAGSRAELISRVAEQIQQRSESFSIHYRGRQDLSDEDMLAAIADFNGTEFNTLLQSVYGMESIEARYSYYTGQDIRFNFKVDYTYGIDEKLRLEADLQRWADSHLSGDMPGAVKAAVVTRYLSDHLLYVLHDPVNNAFDGFYGQKTACSGYAELAWYLFQKSGLPVRMIGGHIPEGLTDTEYLNRRMTASDFLNMDFQSVDQELRNLHVWNMVQINGNWYHLDTTWVDGDAPGKPEEGGYNAAYFLGGDGDFGRNHLWIRGEYPVAAGNWWDNGSDDLRDFLKAYLNTRIYDYPVVSSLKELNSFAEDAYRSGRGSQSFRITQGIQPYDVFPTLGSMQGKVVSSRSNYRTVPEYPGDRYVLTLEFKGRDADAREMLPEMKTALKVQRGDSFSPVGLLKNPERSDHAPLKWMSLSPSMLKVMGDNFTAQQDGRGYIGAYTRDEAVIIPVAIEIPPLQVFLNGSAMPVSPEPVILNGRTLVPLRSIFEAMGATVDYDPENRRITGVRGDKTLVLTLGSRKAVINGQEKILDVPPQIIDGRALVPARLVAESLGASVEWDGLRNRVMITESNP